MGEFELETFSSDDALARKAARLWIDEIVQSARAGKSHCVALSGGRIAERFFAATTERASQESVSFAHVHFFWADERCVPATSKESNFGLAKKFLLDPLGIDGSRVHRLCGETDPDRASIEASELLRALVPKNAKDVPALDLVLLGMGEDGHVASLFPEESFATTRDPALFRTVNASKAPPKRITMGYLPLVTAKEAWVLVAGTGKDRAFRDSLSQGSSAPLSRIIQMRERTRILVSTSDSWNSFVPLHHSGQEPKT